MIPTGTRLGRYEIVSRLGAGGMGEVYRARDPSLGRDVAIKVLPESLAKDGERLRRFEQEARAAGALNHPSVLAVHDVGMSGGRPFLVTELLEGDDLRRLLRAGPLAPRRAVDLAVQIAHGLAAAHDKGIIHRDLKPENVFVTADRRAKLLDFGLAKLAPPSLPTGSMDETATSPGTVIGTIGYMSPEQVRGDVADQRSDLFAFGAILYEMLSGRRVFARASAAETLAAILKEDAPPLAGTPDVPALERIARRCLEKDPRDRFQSARDVAFALEAVVTSPDGPAAAGPRPPQRSVAVLPFKDLSGSPENAHLGLGLADATITELAALKSLLVRPTAAILRYREGHPDPQQAGRELSVDAVVDGSFQRAGSRLRVTLQLVDAGDGRSLWAAKIDTTLDDVFQMQDEVSRKIAEALKVELTAAEQKALLRGPRGGGEAYDLYLKGRVLLLREDLGSVNAAIDSFERAIQADPGFAPAFVGLADAYARIAFSFDPEGDWHARAQSMSDRALALDARLPEGRYIRGLLMWSPAGGFDTAAALREFGAAARGRPSLQEAHTWLGIVLFHVALLEESAGELRQALAISPADPQASMHLGFCLYHQGRYREALELSEGAADRFNPGWGLYQIALCQLRLGRLDEASETIERAFRQVPGNVLVYPVRGLVAASRDEPARARSEVKLTVQNRRAFGHFHHAQYDVACIHALLGDRELALEWLRDAARNGYPCHAFFRADPLLESVRGDERFIRLMDELQAECDGYRMVYEEARTSSAGSLRGGGST